ncbi:MAG: DMT family transporter [Desulfocapsaceae bacterium]|nr:DMT family transporter [Desulfocapsaceae bacterium]
MNRTEGDSLLRIHLLMGFSAFLVSTSFIVGKAITAGLDPAALTLIRFVLATLFLLPYIIRYHGLMFSWSLFFRCAIISLSLVAFFYSMFLSLRYTSALNTSVIFTLVPSFAGIYALLLVKERLTGAKVIALVCGMIGAVWVIFRGDLDQLLAMQWNKGDLIFMAGCVAMGLYTPLVRLLTRREPMVVMTFWILVTGSIWLLLLSGQRLFSIEWHTVSTSVWLGICYLALFTTVITFFLTQYSIGFLGPTRVMAYSYLYPSLVLLLDMALGKGLPQLRVLPGVLVVLAAMFVIQWSARLNNQKGHAAK